MEGSNEVKFGIGDKPFSELSSSEAIGFEVGGQFIGWDKESVLVIDGDAWAVVHFSQSRDNEFIIGDTEVRFREGVVD